MFNSSEVAALEIPRFEFPWPSACHPQVAAVEERMILWAGKHDLFPSPTYRARVVRARYGYLAARCYPNAEVSLLQAISDYFLWFFLVDDLFVDRVETVTPSTLTNLAAMIDVLDWGRARSTPVYGEEAWLDVCRRLQANMSAEQFDRFANGMRLWATTAGLQILNHLQSVPIAIVDYETIRRHTSGMNPCIALSEAANGARLAPDEYHHPDTCRLRAHTNNVVCWSNDIQSLLVEARQPGQFRNMVTLYAGEGRPLQQAVDVTSSRVRAEVDGFVQLEESVRPWASPALRDYIQGMKHWMCGYQDWYDHDTQRYAPDSAAQEADDRAVLVC